MVQRLNILDTDVMNRVNKVIIMLRNKYGKYKSYYKARVSKRSKGKQIIP